MIGAIQIAWSFLPGLLWLYWVYKKDVHEPEPLRVLLKVYALGMCIVIPAAITNSIGLFFFPMSGAGVVSAAIASFLIVGPLEELWKMLVVRQSSKYPEFDEPMDGIVYSGAAALGFASLENLLYLYDHGWQVIHLRAFTAVPGHFLFAVFYGYAYGIRKAGHRSQVLLAWATAALFHGAYNFFLAGGSELGSISLIFSAFVLLLVLAWVYRRLVRRALAISPFRPTHNEFF